MLAIFLCLYDVYEFTITFIIHAMHDDWTGCCVVCCVVRKVVRS